MIIKLEINNENIQTVVIKPENYKWKKRDNYLK